MRRKLTTAVLAALPMLVLSSAYAQQADSSDGEGQGAQKAKNLDKVMVTGSLIPQAQIETATPTATITADDIKARGFTTVADALQQLPFSSGAVQGGQFGAGFTPGAQTLSLFGMPVGFTKYLIDGLSLIHI